MENLEEKQEGVVEETQSTEEQAPEVAAEEPAALGEEVQDAPPADAIPEAEATQEEAGAE